MTGGQFLTVHHISIKLIGKSVFANTKLLPPGEGHLLVRWEGGARQFLSAFSRIPAVGDNRPPYCLS
jgi:hypothetical protein